MMMSLKERKSRWQEMQHPKKFPVSVSAFIIESKERYWRCKPGMVWKWVNNVPGWFFDRRRALMPVLGLKRLI